MYTGYVAPGRSSLWQHIAVAINLDDKRIFKWENFFHIFVINNELLNTQNSGMRG